MATKRTSDASASTATIAGMEDDSPDVPAPPGYKLRLIRPHPLVQNMRQRVETPDPYGRPSSSERQRLDVQVSKQMFKPALVVMDRLIKALETQGLKVEVTEDHRGHGTYVCHGRDRAQLSVRERTRRVEHVPTDKELREKERYSWTRIPKWDDEHTGELELLPGGRVDLSSDEAIDLLVRKAVADAIELIGKARKRREAEEAERRREWERQQAIAAEKERVEAMKKAAAALREYRVLTDYIEEVRRFGRIPDDQRREGQTLEEWLAWAEAQAQQIHPLGD